MALINCPECGRQISDQAKNCIDCGYPVKQETTSIEERNDKTTTQPTVVVESKEGCFLQTLNVGCMILAVIILLSVLILFGLFS